MKDSGISWIGAIPEHWEASKIGQLYDNRYVRVSDKDFEPLSVTMQGILPQLETAAKTDDGDNRKLVRKGDFAINSRSDRRGSCGISPQDGSVSLINLILAPRTSMNADYYNWLFHTTLFADEFYSWGHGIVADLWTTRWQEMKNIAIPVPPLAEQEAIAAYLNEKCGEIDELIDVEQQMISDLESYRQAIITEAVTHGLNPNVPTKDSNIPQIPQIPKNWVTTKIKFLSNLYSGSNITTEEITDSGYPVYGGNGLRGFYDRYNKDGEYVLIGRQGALCGNINYAYGKFWASEHAIVCHPLVEYHLIWFGELLRSMNLNQYSVAAAQPGLSVDKIRNLYIPVPPLVEQVEIGEYIAGKCTEIDGLIKVKQEKIETLKQYRQSLIFEAVTGKITIA
ncbi:MAG: type I restriction endonuclease subunit S [Bacteroides sp.]|nr:type I restriction endonuclease subunit S [Bacteroides sp.]